MSPIPTSNFNPRSPHGERLVRVATLAPLIRISIHAPRTGSDAKLAEALKIDPLFQSTLPARGATNPRRNHARQQIYFNPRSPHGERPTSFFPTLETIWNFNPRSPHGERPQQFLGKYITDEISIHAPRTGSDRYTATIVTSSALFQSTLPARGATGWRCSFGCRSCDFNPRSPHGERRIFRLRSDTQTYNFNPRSPHGERPGF